MNRFTLLPWVVALCVLAWAIPCDCEAKKLHICCDSISSDRDSSYVRQLEGTIPYDIVNHAVPRHLALQFYENIWPGIVFEEGDVFSMMIAPALYFGADVSENAA